MPKTAPKPISQYLPKRLPYDPNIGLALCAYLAMGDRLVEAAAKVGFQSDITIYEWLITEPDFAEIYDRAKEIRAHRIFDGLRELASTATAENAHAIRLRVDTDKWILGKMLPKAYGDKISGDLNINMSLEALVIQSIKLSDDALIPHQNEPETGLIETSARKHGRATWHSHRLPPPAMEDQPAVEPAAAETKPKRPRGRPRKS